MNPKKVLLARLEKMSDDLLRREALRTEPSPEEVEAIRANADREIEVMRFNRSTSQVREILLALERVDHGQYGVCTDCGDGIAKKRLEALPWAARCVHCQEALDRVPLAA